MNSKIDSSIISIRSQWNILWWIIGTFFLPISIPYIFLNFYKYYNENKYRNCLPSKVVVITGASSGLGESLAHIFYKSGCKVVLTARRQNELERVRKELLQTHTTVPTHPPVVVPLDLSDIENLSKIIEKILEIFGHIDILINNGGISVRSDIISSSIDIDMKIMKVNYFGAVALTKAVLPSMIKRKEGRIVFISSIQGKFALPFRSSYSASKHALQAFADSLRAEIAQYGVRVTCISPGYIRTSLSLNALTNTGQPHGKLDDTTATGTDPNKMAKNILKLILRDEKDVILSQLSGKFGYWLRFLSPSIYFWIMEKRANKGLTRT